MVRDNIILDV